MSDALDPALWRETLDENLLWHLDAEHKTLDRHRKAFEELDGDEAPEVEKLVRGMYETQNEVVRLIESEAVRRGLIEPDDEGF